MPENKIDSAVASELTRPDFSVASQKTDGPTGQKETIWMNK